MDPYGIPDFSARKIV